MWMQWGDQRDYIMKSWNVGWFIGTMFVIINLLGQLIPCGMILLRKKTDLACGILVFIIAFQVSSVKVRIAKRGGIKGGKRQCYSMIKVFR
jgi:hypothetical protein